MATNAAARQRLRYERRKNGLCVVPVVCIEERTVAVLLVDGLLLSEEPTRKELAGALSRWTYQHMLTRERQIWPDVLSHRASAL
jgi:hypothetical protein